jgi:hypothetical protein
VVTASGRQGRTPRMHAAVRISPNTLSAITVGSDASQVSTGNGRSTAGWSTSSAGSHAKFRTGVIRG